VTLKASTIGVFRTGHNFTTPRFGGTVPGSSDCQRKLGQTVRVWDASTGQETLRLKGRSESVDSVAFSPDGRRIVSGSWDNTVRVWDAASGQETLMLKGHTSWANSVAFSPDGKRIVSGSADQTIKVWDGTGGPATLGVHGADSQ
jgi:WD40 repeat protein